LNWERRRPVIAATTRACEEQGEQKILQHAIVVGTHSHDRPLKSPPFKPRREKFDDDRKPGPRGKMHRENNFS
jgi:hypothetical protein